MSAALVAAVVGGPGGPAGQLAQGMRERGVAVTELAAGDRAVLTAQLRAAGPLQLVVWAPFPGLSGSPSPLMDQDEAGWDAGAAQPLRAAVTCFQAAQQALDGGGTIVAVLPTLAMSGAAGLTAWTTAAEGLRSLVKVAARDFGKRGITVNAVAVPAAVLAGGSRPLDRPGLPAASLPVPTGAGGEIAGIIAALASPPWTAVTGATIAVDGGVWVPA